MLTLCLTGWRNQPLCICVNMSFICMSQMLLPLHLTVGRTVTLRIHASCKDNGFAWSICIDPMKVSSMKLILFIVYKQHQRSLEKEAARAATACVPAQTCGETEPRSGCISFHHDHSFAAYCFVYIKLNCNATPERYNWPQPQIKWL